jgi:hypothetical protein
MDENRTYIELALAIIANGKPFVRSILHEGNNESGSFSTKATVVRWGKATICKRDNLRAITINTPYTWVNLHDATVARALADVRASMQ